MKLKQGIELIGSDIKKSKKSKCVVCGKKTDNIAYVAKSY
jgi:hypothetical protein